MVPWLFPQEANAVDSVNKTLYIPLYGKSYISKRGIILNDPKAEEIWEKEGFSLKGKSASKWLAFYMGMRAAVFDRWVCEKLREFPDAVVLHLGCGLDSRCLRTGTGRIWYDVDFPDVIAARKRYYPESDHYQMIGADVREGTYLSQLQGRDAIVVMEGISMYLTREELRQLLVSLTEHFERVHLLMDCYTEFAAKASKFKNPINDVGVTQVYGLDDPRILQSDGLAFVKEPEMTPQYLIDELHGMEKYIFRKLYAGGVAKKMYRLYEYRT